MSHTYIAATYFMKHVSFVKKVFFFGGGNEFLFVSHIPQLTSIYTSLTLKLIKIRDYRI
jgi:hypothetical protein